MKSLFAASSVLASFAHLTADAGDRYERIAEPMAPRNIQVLLEKDVKEALLEVRGPYHLFNPHDG